MVKQPTDRRITPGKKKILRIPKGNPSNGKSPFANNHLFKRNENLCFQKRKICNSLQKEQDSGRRQVLKKQYNALKEQIKALKPKLLSAINSTTAVSCSNGASVKEKTIRFADAKEYDGNDPLVERFMMALNAFIAKRGQTGEQIVAFVRQFSISKVVFHTLSLLVENMKESINTWKKLIEQEGQKLLTVGTFNVNTFKQIEEYIQSKIPYPLLFPNGLRQGENPRVSVSERRFALLQQVLVEAKSMLEPSSSIPTPSA